VLQYTCGRTDDDLSSRVRDGTGDENDQVSLNDYADPKYGMHESAAFYRACASRERNKGLFIADRNLNGDNARFTRQNNNGNDHGFECAEERDYYPYWHPTSWRDIAVLTDDISRCDYYQSESQNVKAKGYCPDNTDGTAATENNEKACITAGKEWQEEDSWGLGAPTCIPTDFSRDNHLGNGPGGNTNSFNWTLPTSTDESCISEDVCACVFRIRYNISTNDIDNWGFVDAASNGDNSPVKNNPTVDVANGAYLKLALNTNQFGRTFEDRSHVFHIKARPSSVPATARVFNLNVRGKRGNIVQTYPATEYDFVPQILSIRKGDYVHFQWTGSDSNPAGNDGEGTTSTDRSNIVQVKTLADSKPADEDWLNTMGPALFNAEDRYLFAWLNQTGCGTLEELKALDNNDPNNCLKLNKGEPYFDGGLHSMDNTGAYLYISARNNNFSNRSQKGQMFIAPLLPSWAVALVVLGSVLFVGSAGVGAAMFYAKRNPSSRAAEIFKKVSEVTG